MRFNRHRTSLFIVRLHLTTSSMHHTEVRQEHRATIIFNWILLTFDSVSILLDLFLTYVRLGVEGGRRLVGLGGFHGRMSESHGPNIQ